MRDIRPLQFSFMDSLCPYNLKRSKENLFKDCDVERKYPLANGEA